MAQSKPFLINDYPVLIGIDFGKISMYNSRDVPLFTIGALEIYNRHYLFWLLIRFHSK
jgi:hypothetical protein